jgi:hypothetical protein
MKSFHRHQQPNVISECCVATVLAEHDVYVYAKLQTGADGCERVKIIARKNAKKWRSMTNN